MSEWLNGIPPDQTNSFWVWPLSLLCLHKDFTKTNPVFTNRPQKSWPGKIRYSRLRYPQVICCHTFDTQHWCHAPPYHLYCALGINGLFVQCNYANSKPFNNFIASWHLTSHCYQLRLTQMRSSMVRCPSSVHCIIEPCHHFSRSDARQSDATHNNLEKLEASRSTAFHWAAWCDTMLPCVPSHAATCYVILRPAASC